MTIQLKLFTIISLLIFVLGCTNTSTTALQFLSQDAKILAFGNSLTSGSGSSPGRDYPTQLAQMTQRTVINAGRPGELSSQAVQRLPKLLREHNPDLVVLIHGGNDLLRKLDTQQTRDNLAAMIKMLTDANISVVLLGVPGPALWLRSAEFYSELAQRWKLPFDEDVLPEILSDRQLKSDQIHPNDKGYRVLAQAVHKLLKTNGAI